MTAGRLPVQKAWKTWPWAVLALLLAGPALAQTLQLVTGDDYAPYTDPALPEGGMLTEVVRKALRAAGHEVLLDWKPWVRGYDESKRGLYAGTFPYVPTAERQADFLYSDPLYEIRQVVYVRTGTNINPAKLESFAGHVQCLPQGWALPDQLAPLLKEKRLRLLRPLKMADCARMVASGFGDFFVVDSLQGSRILHQASVTSAKVAPHANALSKWTLHLIVGKQRHDGAAILQKFNSGLKVLKNSGEYAEIVKRHTELAARP